MPSTDPNRGEAVALPDDAETVGFDRLYGLEVTEVGDGEARGRVALGDDHMQPAGIAHGGVYASMAESLSSIATWLAVNDGGKRSASGMNNNTSFLRPIASGTVHAHARARHRGRTTWVWEVEITDDQGRLAALSRVTVAIRDL